MLTSALNETGIIEAGKVLLTLPDSGVQLERGGGKTTAHNERKILESPQLDDILTFFSGRFNFVSEAIGLGGRNISEQVELTNPVDLSVGE